MMKPIASSLACVGLLFAGVGFAAEHKIDRLGPALGRPRALLGVGDALYLATSAQVVRFELTPGRGEAPPKLVPLLQSQLLAGGLAVDGAELFWGNQDDGAVVRGLVPGLLGGAAGALKTLATGLTGLCGAVAVDRRAVYVSTCADVLAVPRAGGAPRKVAGGAGPLFVADSGFIYLFSGDKLLKVPKGGGKARTLAQGQGVALALAQDERGLYFQAGGGVHRVGKDGGALTTLAQVAAQQKGSQAASLAVADGRVYYIDGAGAVARAPMVVGKGAPIPVPGGAALVALHRGGLYAASLDGAVFRLVE